MKPKPGINADYEGSGNPANYYQVISGGFTGEARTQSILKQFEAETGINADYEGLGEPENYYRLSAEDLPAKPEHKAY